MKRIFCGIKHIENTMGPVSLLVILLISMNQAYASHLSDPGIQFDITNPNVDIGSVGSAPFTITVLNTTANTSDDIFDTVTVHVTSTTDPIGIFLTLSEEDHDFQGLPDSTSGTFRNENLILMKTNNIFPINSKTTISITDHPQNVSTTAVDTLLVSAKSTSELTGILLNFPETGNNTGVFS